MSAATWEAVRRFLLGICALAVAGALPACGGGGGGGGSSGSAANPPAGNEPPRVTLTESNAIAAAGIVLDGLGHASFAAEMASAAADSASALGSHTARCIDPAGREVPMPIALIDNDNSGTVSVNDAVTIEFVGCGGESRRARLTLRSVDRIGERIEGRLTFHAESAAGLVAEGELDFASTYLVPRSRYRQTLSNLRMTASSGGLVDTFTGATLERAFDANTRYTFLSSGSVSSARWGGNFEFALPQAFVGSSGFFPDTGELLLTAGASQASFAAHAEPPSIPEFVDYRIDAAGAGYAATTREHWLAVTSALLFGVTPSSRPVISSFEITPANPHAGHALHASYTVENPGNDPVTHSFIWRRNGVVLPFVFFDTAAPRQFQRGDVVEVELRVSNGRWSDVATASVTIRNEPPVVTLTLSPPAARSIDTLTLAAAATDGDGDSVQLRFEWRRNGIAIPGQTGASLPETEHARSDVITGVATASDGMASTVAEITVTIADSPPRVTVASAPVAARYGDTVAFVAQAEDPDGDAPGSFEILYGPAGMSVDPDTGAVSFGARGPMFDKSMSFGWGITTSYAGAVPATGAVAVDDPARKPPLLRTGLQLSQAAGLEAADFDADGDVELLVLAPVGLYELSMNGGGYRQSWMYPFAVGTWLANRAFATSDVDGDASREIFLAQGDVIAKLDGAERRLAAIAAPFADDSDGCTDLEIGDVDADGAAEVVCLAAVTLPGPPYNSRILIVLNAATLAVEWQAPFAEYGRFVELANVDADAPLEIVTSSGYVFDGQTHAIDWHRPAGFGPSQLAVGDMTGDGVAEIFAGTDVGFDQNDPGTIRAFDAQAQTMLWSIANRETASLALADVAGDARLELLVGDGDGNATGSADVTAYAMTGPGAPAIVFDVPGGALDGVIALAAGDVDADGERELVWSASPLALTIVGPGPAFDVEWRSAYDRTLLRGPYAGGMLARDGLNMRAPLFASWTSWEAMLAGTRVFALDPVTTDLRIGLHDFGQFAFPGFALDVADYDRDGVDEAFLGLAPAAGSTHTAYDFFGERAEWTAPPLAGESGPISIAHGDLNGDGSDDLVAIGANALNMYDIAHGALLGRITGLAGVDVEVAELSGGGVPELIVAERGRVLVYRQIAGGYSPAEVVDVIEVRDTAVGDVDGDGHVDIFVISGFPPSTQVHRFNDRLEPSGSFELPWYASGITIESSAFARKNLALSGAENHSGYVVVVDPRTGQEVWRSPRLNGPIARESVHFIDVGDGPRLSLATELGVYLTQ